MRITVGHIILLAGIGAGFALKGGGSVDWVKTQAGSAVNGVKDLVGLIVDSERPVTPTGPAPVAEPEGTRAPLIPDAPANPLAAPPVQAVAASSAAAPASAEAVKSGAAPKKEAVKKQAEKKQVRRKKRQRRKKVAQRKNKAAQTTAVKPAQKQSQKFASLVGTYVEIELKTGRAVKGVLREATAKELTVELPGLGPFKYPATNVKTVKTAE